MSPTENMKLRMKYAVPFGAAEAATPKAATDGRRLDFTRPEKAVDLTTFSPQGMLGPWRCLR
ncbi:MAG TPA: hypothetical protein VME70_11685 [Mycobacteriales bacterium]|nr:hypothetical protein [Mycobacteriales bacterium]